MHFFWKPRNLLQGRGIGKNGLDSSIIRWGERTFFCNSRTSLTIHGLHEQSSLSLVPTCQSRTNLTISQPIECHWHYIHVGDFTSSLICNIVSLPCHHIRFWEHTCTTTEQVHTTILLGHKNNFPVSAIILSFRNCGNHSPHAVWFLIM